MPIYFLDCRSFGKRESLEKRNPPARRALLSADPYTSTSALAQGTTAASRTPLSELVVGVREWLCTMLRRRRGRARRRGVQYWRFTKHRVMPGGGRGI